MSFHIRNINYSFHLFRQWYFQDCKEILKKFETYSGKSTNSFNAEPVYRLGDCFFTNLLITFRHYYYAKQIFVIFNMVDFCRELGLHLDPIKILLL